MNLARGLERRAAAGRPVRVGVIGAGKFGSMFLAQARRTPGLHVVAIADRDVAKVRTLLAAAGWEAEQFAASSPVAARDSGRTHLGDDGERVIATDGIEVVVEATGDPRTGLRHAVAAIAAGRHVVMVTVEADVIAGPLLAERAAAAGVLYSLAYGDQPALICEQVDWARTAGFRVTAAGKGTRYHPSFHQSTPDTVWNNFGLDPAVATRGYMDPKMFNSFIDGSKSAIEMTAVCNATGLVPQAGGLSFPPVARHELAHHLRPRAAGGVLALEPGATGVTEVVSSLHRDGSPVAHDLRMGTYVVVEAGQEYVAQCIREYGFQADASGSYLALYRPDHLIGLELGVSIASVAVRGEPTGAATGFRSDVVAVAKRDLAAGEELDGEGGYTVWGKQLPAARSLELGALPLGLAQRVILRRGRAVGEVLRWMTWPSTRATRRCSCAVPWNGASLRGINPQLPRPGCRRARQTRATPVLPFPAGGRRPP